MEKTRKLWKKCFQISCITIVISIIGLIVYYVLNKNGIKPKCFGELFAALLFVAVQYTIISRLILSDDKKLKKDYIRRKDERNINIQEKAAKTTFYFFGLSFCFAALIFNFINETIANLLFVCILALTGVYSAFILYYRKKI